MESIYKIIGVYGTFPESFREGLWETIGREKEQYKAWDFWQKFLILISSNKRRVVDPSPWRKLISEIAIDRG